MYKPNARRSTTVTVSETRQAFAEIVNRVAYGQERVVVARHGRDLVAVVNMADLDRLLTTDAAAAPGQPAAQPNVRPRTARRTEPRP